MVKKMKVFISHSSKDKHFARKIADELGDMRCEFDEYSFEFTLNSSAIRKALDRSSLFILLLSENSIKSEFVAEELRGALERRGSGKHRDVVIFSIDGTSFKGLPDWMREINVAQYLRSPKQIATRIDARLTEISLEQGNLTDFYFGRSSEEQLLRLALSKPKKESPIAIHAVGHSGVGRKTFLRNSLKVAAPRHYSSFIELEIGEYDSIDELYRHLYGYMEIHNPLVAGEKLARFSLLNDREKSAEIANYIREMAKAEIFPIFIDEGGVLQDNGDYQPHFPILLEQLADMSRPALAFIQFRMMKHSFKKNHPRSFHIRIDSLQDETVFELMCLKLKDLDVDFEPLKVREAQKFTDGHPFNVNLVTAFIADEGMDVLLSDPTEIIETKVERGRDFLRKIDFSEIEEDIISVLHEYRTSELEFILVALDRRGIEVTECIRRLEDFCCIERRDSLITISPPIRDAIRRDKRFHRSTEWHTNVGRRVVESISKFENSESISLSFIDSALPELLRQKKEVPFITALILPTHFLRVARDYYDKSKWRNSVDFCRQALDGADRLTMDAKVEANRLLGLALTRLNAEDPKISEVIVQLRSYVTPTGNRVAFFIEGFRARRRGQLDIAVDKFLEASKLGRDNYHINRELSSVLCRQERYAEAEPYARAAYSKTPDNPYIVDVLIEALEGKQSQGLPVDNAETLRLDRELKILCDAGDFQFHQLRLAKKLHNENKSIEAFNTVREVFSGDQAAQLTYQRGKLFIRSTDFSNARKDIKFIRQIDIDSAENALFADQLEAECLIAESRFSEARDFIQARFSQSENIKQKLITNLVRAIGFTPEAATADLKSWARGVA